MARTVKGIGAATAALAVVALAAWAAPVVQARGADGADHDADGGHGTGGRPAATCTVEHTVAPDEVIAPYPSQTVEVRVPRTAVISVDARGRVLAVWTNTGCPPADGDELWYQLPDGRLIRTADQRLVRRPWYGDFSESGVFQSQLSHDR